MLTTMNTDVEVIADHIAPVQHGWSREVTVRTVGHKVRARISRDHYDHQSRIAVEVWSPAELKWNTVRTLPGSDHGDLPSSATLSARADAARQSAAKREIFSGTAELVDELIAYAQQVLA